MCFLGNNTKATMHVVWFKRDLRSYDHRALAAAAEAGPVIPLYVIEPDLWSEPDMSGRQWAFVKECLTELRDALAAAGQPLIVRRGEVTQVLTELQQETGFTHLWSHEETGNDWTYQRDKRVADWCRAASIEWSELRNHGVQRRLASRNGWAADWDRFMAEPITPTPHLKPVTLDLGAITLDQNLPDNCRDRQIGGRAAGLDCLNSFLYERGRPYRSAMSSPLEGAVACSRISPHLAWGSLSMREVAQATWARQRDLKAQPPAEVKGWRGSMTSFNGRLHWHCHFIQKLEDEPEIEFRNLHRAYDGFRPSEPDAARLHAWAHGETGLPFLDACMRSLRATGWLNFRMRAMVTAVASYHLWLPWRSSGEVLARLFTDYEPGIHWSQVQMQSGTTGINTIRIYNPVKQGHDQDPTGAFTRHWIPELKDIPDTHLQEPWLAESAGAVLGRSYPEPIVDYKAAAKDAREKIWTVRRGDDFRAAAGAIQNKHGSRKSGIPNSGQRRRKPSAEQMSLPLSPPSE